MRLINVSVNEALGYQVAHSQMGHRNRLQKASMITQADILDLIAAGIDTLQKHLSLRLGTNLNLRLGRMR